MRPLRPFCGTVLKAQLLTLPATISTSAKGVVTTQLSFLPPASSSATDVWGSSESRPATVHPPEPPPTTTKSNVSITRIPPMTASFFEAKLRFCGVYGKGASLSRFWTPNRVIWASQKAQKRALGPFQSGDTLIHTPRTQGHCPGRLLRKPLDGIDRRGIKRW